MKFNTGDIVGTNLPPLASFVVTGYRAATTDRPLAVERLSLPNNGSPTTVYVPEFLLELQTDFGTRKALQKQSEEVSTVYREIREHGSSVRALAEKVNG